jgi:beta-mannosidase
MGQETLTWQFFQPVSKQWIEAGTHGSVQEKLIDIGELPDPFYGENENKFGWIEEQIWEFNSHFSITEQQMQKDFIALDFPGIDTYAVIFLNDSLIGYAQNAFRPYHFEVKNKLKLGDNVLRVTFYPPVLYNKEKYKKAKYKLPAPNDVNEIAIAPYTRKPQYQFGWDWALRMNTLGFLKPVVVNFYNENKISSKNILTSSISEKSATMIFELQFRQKSKTNLIWRSKLFGDVILPPSEQKISREEEITNPKLWWPRGQGEQFLYEDVWTILTEEGEIIDEQKIRFGIRKTELVMDTDKWGTSYVIKFNGRPIFCKGGDYIPQDIFPARVKDADLRNMIETMAESNFNMVRVWGGGYYPDEAFFEACDELGIMVWQDFMFACSIYPGDPEFLGNVKEEIDYQIPRIASHPSLTIFNGNNEVDVAWKNWGFQVKYNLYGKDAQEIEDSYVRLFKELIPKQITSFTNSPYIHTSPLSNWGKDEYYDHGTQHYWGVWHGKDPLDNFAKKIGRFNTEYGFQSFPEYSTLESFSTKKEWDLESNVMKHHQKSYVGNGMILKHAKVLYGNPATFEDFVYYSQLTQATAVSMAVTGHRLDAPRCMGTLYWQVNDCWPAPSWSSVDYFGNWKALQYRVKEDYEDVAVLSKINEHGVQEYYFISDQIDTFMCEMQFTVFNLEGKELFKNTVSQLIKGNEAEKICDTRLKKELSGKNYFIRFAWKNSKGEQKTRTFSNLTSAYKKADNADVSIKIKSVSAESKTAIITIENKKYVRNCWLYSNVFGVKFDSNFNDLLPGIHEFEIKFIDIPKDKDFELKWM